MTISGSMARRRVVAVAVGLVLTLSHLLAPQAAEASVFNAPATGLLWLNRTTGELSQWNLNGSGVVLGKTTWAMTCIPQNRCNWYDEIAGVAEMDGRPGYDLLTRDSSPILSRKATFLHTDAKSSGMFHWTADCGPECQYDAVGIRDFNRDGKQDVLWYDPRDGYPRISLFDGSGHSFSSMTVNRSCDLSCYGKWHPVGVGDVNSDGYRDLLWWNVEDHSPGFLEAWLLNDRGEFIGTQRLSWQCADDCRGGGWNPIGLGDINGDGTQDLMWHNFFSGSVATWLLDGHGNVIRDHWLDWTCDYTCGQTWRPVAIIDPENFRFIRVP